MFDDAHLIMSLQMKSNVIKTSWVLSLVTFKMLILPRDVERSPIKLMSVRDALILLR